MSSSPAKRPKLYHPNDKRDTFLQRWLTKDKETMLGLRKCGVAMLEWKDAEMERTCIPPTHLVGEYDVVCIHGEGAGTDQGFEVPGPLSRTVPKGAVLSFVAKEIEEGEEDMFPDGEKIFGYISELEKTINPASEASGFWDYCIQMNDVSFEEHDPDDDYFYLLEADGDTKNGEEVNVQVISNSGIMKWIPTEEYYKEHPEDKHAYIEFMRAEMEKRKTGHRVLEEDKCWLCREKGFPKEAANKVYSFLSGGGLPPFLDFQWQEGDVIVSIDDTTEYATSWSTVYLARPRTEELRDHLLAEAKKKESQST